jgi:phage tail sheath protein FI
MATLNSNIITAPGVYVTEDTAGLIPAGLATFNRTYMMGEGASGAYNTPTQVISETDFTNQFGVSSSLTAVRMFFRNYQNGILYFIRVAAPNLATVQVGTPAAGAYTLTIQGTAVTYTATSTDTESTIATGLINAINAATLTPTVIPVPGSSGLFRIETTTVGSTLTVVSTATPGGSSLTVSSYGHTVTIAGTSTTGVYGLTISGTVIATASLSTPTATAAASALATAIQANATVNALVDVSTNAGVITITPRTGTLVSATALTAPTPATMALTSTVTTPATYNKYVYGIQNSFDPDLHQQGFMIAPEAFSTLTTQSHRTSVATAMENQCSTENYYWMALVDAGPVTTITSVTMAQQEGRLYTTARGHLAYYYPYLKDLEANSVPPSPAVAAIALRRYREQGFNQPPAGAQYPVRGVTDVVVRLKQVQQAVVNPFGINLVRYFPNQGTIVYGARTRSSSAYYRFVNTRIILNVLVGTLETVFSQLVFSAVDGQGVLFSRIKATADQVCYQLWDGGALYGATPGAAFACFCNANNNPAIDLEQGIVRVDVYVVPAPTMERLLISVYRTPIGQIQAVTQGVEN